MSSDQCGKKYTRSANQKTINGTVYYDGFSVGVLPTQNEVMQNMMYLLRPDRVGKIGRQGSFLMH